MTTPTYWTEAPIEQTTPIRTKISEVLEIIDIADRPDMQRVRDVLRSAFWLVSPNAQYQQISQAVMDLTDAAEMLRFRQAPITAGYVDRAACAAKSLLANMDEILE